MSGLDVFCLRGLAATAALMLALAASEHYPVETQPVVLKPIAATCDPADFVCVLHSESLAKARPTQGKGYSERERNEMNQLIARLP